LFRQKNTSEKIDTPDLKMLRRKLLPIEGNCAWINAGIILLDPSMNDLENFISITRGIHCFMEDEP
jgi:hypothetical protein